MLTRLICEEHEAIRRASTTLVQTTFSMAKMFSWSCQQGHSKNTWEETCQFPADECEMPWKLIQKKFSDLETASDILQPHLLCSHYRNHKWSAYQHTPHLCTVHTTLFKIHIVLSCFAATYSIHGCIIMTNTTLRGLLSHLMMTCISKTKRLWKKHFWLIFLTRNHTMGSLCMNLNSACIVTLLHDKNNKMLDKFFC